MSNRPTRIDGLEQHPGPNGLLVSNPATGVLTWLNRTAELVYLLCTGANDAQAITDTIAEAFDLFQSPRSDVDRALAELQQAGLITHVEAPSADDVSLLIALWAPAPSVPVAVMTYLTAITTQLERAGIRHRVMTDTQPNRTLAHNRAASALVAFEQFSHILFLDASAEASEAVAGVSIERILRSGYPLVGVPVPRPGIDWSRVVAAGQTEPELVAAISRHYDVTFVGVQQPTPRLEGFASARFVSSAAMVASRAGLERFAGSAHVRRYRGLIGDAFVEYLEHLWGFFDPVDVRGGLLLADDVSFCERWQAHGEQVLVDTTGAFGSALAASRSVLGR